MTTRAEEVLALIAAQDQVCDGNVTEAEAWRAAKRLAQDWLSQKDYQQRFRDAFEVILDEKGAVIAEGDFVSLTIDRYSVQMNAKQLWRRMIDASRFWGYKSS